MLFSSLRGLEKRDISSLYHQCLVHRAAPNLNINKISLERGPRGEWGPGSARARMLASIWSPWRARGPRNLSLRGPLSKEIVLIIEFNRIVQYHMKETAFRNITHRFEVCDEKTCIELFSELSFDDLWDDCSDLRDILLYCRGSMRLHIPSEWRSVLPAHLWAHI